MAIADLKGLVSCIKGFAIGLMTKYVINDRLCKEPWLKQILFGSNLFG